MDEENNTPEKNIEEKISPHQEGKLTKKMRENPWILSTFVLGILALILLIPNFGGMTGGVVNEGVAGESFLTFANQQGANAELVGVSEESGLYKVILKIEGQEAPFYVTKNGEYYIPPTGLMPLKTAQQTASPQQEQSTTIEYSEEDSAKIKGFSSCLAKKGLKVYYAGWCGHCHNLIETFGGLENMGSMMIECQTEDRQPGKGADLCATENIGGFPTIKIDGEPYNGARTFEAFAKATGCSAPQLD